MTEEGPKTQKRIVWQYVNVVISSKLPGAEFLLLNEGKTDPRK